MGGLFFFRNKNVDNLLEKWKNSSKNTNNRFKEAVDGADDEARTRYLHLGKVALYQMSYIRNCKRDYSRVLCKCQELF